MISFSPYARLALATLACASLAASGCYLSDTNPPALEPAMSADMRGMSPPDLGPDAAGGDMPDALDMLDASDMPDLPGDDDLSRDAQSDEDASLTDDASDDAGPLESPRPVVPCDAPCIQTIAGDGGLADAPLGSPRDALAATLDDPRGAALLEGALYVTDQRRHMIYKINLSTGEIDPLVGSPDRPQAQDGALATASLRAPHAIVASDPDSMAGGRALYFTQQLATDPVLGWRDYGLGVIELDSGELRSIS